MNLINILLLLNVFLVEFNGSNIFKIGRAEFTENEWQINKQKYLTQLALGTKIDSLVDNIINKKLLASEAYKEGYENDNRVLEAVYFTSKFILLQENNPFFDEFVVSNININENLLAGYKEKSKRLFFFSISNSKSFNNGSSPITFRYPSVQFWAIQDSLYNFFPKEIKVINLNSSKIYVRLDSIKMLDNSLDTNIIEDAAFQIEKEKFLQNLRKNFDEQCKIDIKENAFNVLLDMCMKNEGLVNLLDYKSDSLLFNYKSDNASKSFTVTDLIYNYKNLPVKKNIINEAELRAYITRLVYGDFVYGLIKSENIDQNKRFVTERKIFQEKKMIQFMLEDSVNKIINFSEEIVQRHYTDNLQNYTIDDSVEIYKIHFDTYEKLNKIRRLHSFEEKIQILKSEFTDNVEMFIYNYPPKTDLENVDIYSSMFYRNAGDFSIAIEENGESLVLMKGISHNNYVLDYSEVKDKIKKELISKKQETLAKELATKLRAKKKLEVEIIGEKLIRKIRHITQKTGEKL